MRGHKFNERIVFPIFLFLVLLIILLNVYTSVRFMSFSRLFVDEKLTSGVHGLNTLLDEAYSNSKTAAVSMSMNPDAVKAISGRDREEILRLFNEADDLYSVNFFTITDAEGNVLVRTHDPESYGDSIINQKNIRNALTEGVTATYYEQGRLAAVAVRSGAPVYDADGGLVGVISAGVRFDTNETTNSFKNILGVDVTVFLGDKRIATTLEQDGEFAVGTLLNPEVRDVVIDGKKEYDGRVEMLGSTYETYYKPLLNPDGEVFAVVSLAIPIGNLVRNSEIIFASVILMGLISAVMSLILLNALRHAIAADKAKSAFLASMSHEMRTPLNAVIGLSYMTLDNSSLDEQTRFNIEHIHNSGTTLLAIVNDLLDMSKIESGMFELVPVEYDTPSLINDTIMQNMLRIGEKPISFKLDIEDGMYAQLYGDDLRVKQIMNNLLSNAIKYTDKGRVELRLRTLKQGDEVLLTITVSDTGKGIMSCDLDNLFTDYAQFDLNSNRHIEGTGLGLPIASALAAMMNGSIAVKSEYGKGSVFTVELMQKYVSDKTLGKEVAGNLRSFKYSDNKRMRDAGVRRVKLPYASVLVVDDNETNLAVAKGMMQPYGMRVDCVTGGYAAVDAVREGKIRYDAIFMDHMMPGMDGIETLNAIRGIGTPYAKSVPVIALTANAVTGNKEMFLSKGFCDFLAKPMDITQLDEIIMRRLRDAEKEKALGADAFEDADKTLSPCIEISIEGLDTAGAMSKLGGGVDTYIGVLRAFAAGTKKLIGDIQPFSADNIENYGITVHGIKGSSRGVGAIELGELAYELEKAAKNGDIGFIDKHNEGFIESALKIINDIEHFLACRDKKNPKRKKDKPDAETLKTLCAACEAYDMDAADAALEELDIYEYEDGGGLIEWIHDNIDLMNFDEIAERLREETDNR